MDIDAFLAEPAFSKRNCVLFIHPNPSLPDPRIFRLNPVGLSVMATFALKLAVFVAQHSRLKGFCIVFPLERVLEPKHWRSLRSKLYSESSAL